MATCTGVVAPEWPVGGGGAAVGWNEGTAVAGGAIGGAVIMGA